METLNDSQLLLLDTLVYCFGRETEVVPGTAFRAIVDDVDSGLKRRMLAEDAKMGDLMAEQMHYGDWFSVVDAARRDPVLRELVLENYAEDDRNAKVALFSDADGRAYAIFAGSGKGEWDDNCVSAFQRDSEQQLRAVAWFDGAAVDRGYASIVASGHSKGGNKAQYLAIRRGSLIERAVSFDGQGFSREFHAAYADLIAENAGKIVAYARDNDFVNGLMDPIVLPENRHYLRGPRLEQVFANHAPFALFAAPTPGSHVLQLAPEGAQGDIGKMMVALTDYLQREPTDEEFRRICTFLGQVMENLVTSSRTTQQRRDAFYELYTSGDFPLAAGYLLRFFQEMGRKVTLSDLVRTAMPRDDSQDDADTLAQKLQRRLPEKFRGRRDGDISDGADRVGDDGAAEDYDDADGAPADA